MLGAGFPDYDCGPGPLALTSRRFTGPQRSRCSRRFAPRYTAERIDGTEVHTVPLRELSVDNIVVVRPGTRVPADGTVVDGHASVGLGLERVSRICHRSHRLCVDQAIRAIASIRNRHPQCC